MNEDKLRSSKNTQGNTNPPPMRRGKKKRFRKLPFIILIGIIILAIIIGYSVHGYNSGIKYAKDHGKTLKQHKFNGAVKNGFYYDSAIRLYSQKDENDVCDA